MSAPNTHPIHDDVPRRARPRAAMPALPPLQRLLPLLALGAGCGGGSEIAGSPTPPATSPPPAQPVVAPRVVAVAVSPAATTVIVGTPTRLQAQVTVEGGASQQVVWQSSKPAVASVDPLSGEVRGLVGYDSVVVTARAVADTTKAAAALVRVLPPPAPFTVTASASAITIPQGGTGSVLLTFRRSAGFTGPIGIGLGQWASGSDAPGTPRDVAGDTATFTIRVGNTIPFTYTFLLRSVAPGYQQVDVPLAVTVVAPAVSGVTIAPAAASVAEGQSVQLAATVHDTTRAPLAGRGVRWASSDSAVARVDGTGRVTGVRAGAAVVTATSVDNPAATARAAITVTAAAPTAYTLAVTAAAGSVAGTVTSAPAGIACQISAAGAASGACAASFAAGTAVRLTAVSAAAGGTATLGGACPGAAECTVAMSADRIVPAGFAAPVAAATRTLTVRVTGPGTVSGPGGIACTASGGTCAATLPSGSTATLTAQPGAGAAFTGWGDACAGTAATCTLTLASDRSVTAAFAAAPGQVRVTVTGLGGVVGSGGIACGAAGSVCSATLPVGTPVTLTASPGANQTFAGWGGACSGATLTCALTVSGVHDVTAQFAAVTRRLTVSVAGPGTVSGPGGLSCGAGSTGVCAVTLPAGTSATITASPGAGAKFDGWGGACAGTAGSCTLTLDADRAASASFSAATVTLSISGSIRDYSGAPAPTPFLTITGGATPCSISSANGRCNSTATVNPGTTVTLMVTWSSETWFYSALRVSGGSCTAPTTTTTGYRTASSITCTVVVNSPASFSASF